MAQRTTLPSSVNDHACPNWLDHPRADLPEIEILPVTGADYLAPDAEGGFSGILFPYFGVATIVRDGEPRVSLNLTLPSIGRTSNNLPEVEVDLLSRVAREIAEFLATVGGYPSEEEDRYHFGVNGGEVSPTGTRGVVITRDSGCNVYLTVTVDGVSLSTRLSGQDRRTLALVLTRAADTAEDR